MKKIILLLTVLAVILTVFFLAGCKEDATMSIDDRIKEFVKDLNGSSRDGIFKDHFHPDSDSYDGSDALVLEPQLPKGDIYITASITKLSSTTRTVLIGGSDTYTCLFTMKEDGADDWYIWSISGDVNL